MISKEATVVQLTASGPANQLVRTDLVEGTVLRLGRSPKGGWAIPWDQQISREQADLCWENGQLKVTCTKEARNSLQCNGSSQREIVVKPGEAFRIGTTEFRLLVQDEPALSPGAIKGSAARPVAAVENPDELTREHPSLLAKKQAKEKLNKSVFESAAVQAAIDDHVIEHHSYRYDDLKHVKFSDPTRQMELLANLPQLITASESETELALKLVGLLLNAIPHAVAAAVVQYDEWVVQELQRSTSTSFDLPNPRLIRVQSRDSYEGRFVPSRQLLARTMKMTASNMHIWTASGGSGPQFTMSGSLNWAFCTPIMGDSCVGWCLYVAGEGGKRSSMLVTEGDLKGDLRFTELLAQFIGSIRQVRLLQEHKTQLSSFFSPKVIQSLTGGSADDLLKPSERDITAMFCDVRGFSKKSEKSQDNLHELLNCVRAALSAMTGGILDNDGTIADFQGDAAMGFWGWPVALDEGPIPACRAALAVQAEFNKPFEAQGLLQGFSVGIGIAHGRAIAGQIGTQHQAKVGVFGPVVNQGSRLEGMTRQLGVCICIDEATAEIVRRNVSRDTARVRKLGRVRPKGMDTAITVSELLPPAGPASSVTDAMIEQHEAAVEAIISGQWDQARQILQQIPDNEPKQFLLDRMAEFNHTPPADWSGVFALVEK